MHEHSEKQAAGRIVFVGAGPGHPDLITVRAATWLRRADVVVHDALVSQEILDRIGPAARIVPALRDGEGSIDPGEAVGHLLVELAQAGTTVVRLKGGDPSVFARLAEELAPVRQAGVPFEIVPGVTAALAAAAAAGIPLTSRASASSATLITGHEADEKQPAGDVAAVARLPGTLIFYMGVEQVDKWSRELIDSGKSGDTPVTIVSRCSWADQQVAVTTLARCAADFDRHRWQAPAVAIVGEVSRGSDIPPSATRPLVGRRVVVPRPAGQGDEAASLITAAGGVPVAIPALRIEPPASWAAVDDALRQADGFDWIVFSSVNGVRAFGERMRAIGRDGRWLGTARLAAVGPSTAEALAAAGYRCDVVPAEFCAEGLSSALAGDGRRSRFLLLRADRGRDVLKRDLEAAGHEVTDVIAYRSAAVEGLDDRAVAALDAGPIDWIVVTSPAVAEACHRLFGGRLRAWRIATISPLTSAAVRSLGHTVATEAHEATARGLVQAMADWELAHAAQSR
jgi:uroporphyrinogen III methyltransferase/synthase